MAGQNSEGNNHNSGFDSFKRDLISYLKSNLFLKLDFIILILSAMVPKAAVENLSNNIIILFPPLRSSSYCNGGPSSFVFNRNIIVTS